MVDRGAYIDDGGSEVSFAGDLSSMPIEDLLGWLSTSVNTGRMVLEGPEYSKTLFVNKGVLTAASSTNPKEFLGHYLVGWNLVSDEELDHLFRMRKEHDTLVGHLLITLGFLTPERLAEILTVVTEELIFEMFTWPSGAFRFVIGKVPARHFQALDITLTPLILEGVRRRDELPSLRSLVPSDDHRPRSKTTFDINDLSLDKLGEVGEFDGKMSIEAMALQRQKPTFTLLEEIADKARRGLVEVLPPAETPTPTEKKTLKTLRLHAEECLGRGQLAEATRAVEQLTLEYADTTDVFQLACDLMTKINDAANARIEVASTVLELAIPTTSLIEHECTANEGFLLSRIDGRQSVEAILKQLPGDRDANLVSIIDLIDRGLLTGK